MKLVRLIATFLYLLHISTVQAADLYKCQTESGTAYQETPCKGGKKLDVSQAEPNSRDSNIETAISLRRVLVGMTKEQAIRAWGRPTKINQTVGAGYTTEQWVYDRDTISNTQYLYFDNGILRSIQGPRT